MLAEEGGFSMRGLAAEARGIQQEKLCEQRM